MTDEKSSINPDNFIRKNGEIIENKLHIALLNSPNDSVYYLNVIRMLMNNGADPYFLLNFAANQLSFTPYDREKLIKIINVLLDEYDTDINSTNKDTGNTFLMEVVTYLESEHVDLIVFLLDRGARLDLQNKDGMTPLSMAVFYGSDNVEIVKLLLERGADPNLSDKDGITPLMRALSRYRYGENKKIARLLLEHGADSLLEDSQGDKAKDYLNRLSGKKSKSIKKSKKKIKSIKKSKKKIKSIKKTVGKKNGIKNSKKSIRK